MPRHWRRNSPSSWRGFQAARGQQAKVASRLSTVVGRIRDSLRAGAFQRTVARRPVTLRHLARIETLALSDAGRKVARRYGVHVADAIDPTPVAHIKPFVSKKVPQMLKLMSAARRAQLQG
jgi:tRNA (Thr-GGU) A37 N-methylase